MLHLCLPMLFVLATAAVEPDVSRPVDVPDPIGLGERLALIDWMREHRLPVPDDARVEELRRAYLRATRPATTTPVGEDSEAQQRAALALALWKRHGVNAKPEDTVEDLRARLEELDRQRSIVIGSARDDAREPAPTHADEREPATRRGDAASRPAAHAHAAKADPRSAGAPSAATAPAEVPPVDDDHAARWVDYASAPTRSAQDLEVRLYRLAGDDGGLYLWAHNHGVVRRMAVVAIDGHRVVLYVEPGRLRTPTRVAIAPTGDDTLELVDVITTHRALAQGTVFAP